MKKLEIAEYFENVMTPHTHGTLMENIQISSAPAYLIFNFMVSNLIVELMCVVETDVEQA
jgi:hypothetical protein